MCNLAAADFCGPPTTCWIISTDRDATEWCYYTTVNSIAPACIYAKCTLEKGFGISVEDRFLVVLPGFVFSHPFRLLQTSFAIDRRKLEYSTPSLPQSFPSPTHARSLASSAAAAAADVLVERAGEISFSLASRTHRCLNAAQPGISVPMCDFGSHRLGKTMRACSQLPTEVLLLKYERLRRHVHVLYIRSIRWAATAVADRSSRDES